MATCTRIDPRTDVRREGDRFAKFEDAIREYKTRGLDHASANRLAAITFPALQIDYLAKQRQRFVSQVNAQRSRRGFPGQEQPDEPEASTYSPPTGPRLPSRPDGRATAVAAPPRAAAAPAPKPAAVPPRADAATAPKPAAVPPRAAAAPAPKPAAAPPRAATAPVRAAALSRQLQSGLRVILRRSDRIGTAVSC